MLASATLVVSALGCVTRPGPARGRLAAVRPAAPAPTPAPVGIEPLPAEAGGKRRAAVRLVEHADAALTAGRVAEAADLLERAVAVDPRFAATYVGLARVHLAEGDHQTALAFCERAELLATGDVRVQADVAALRGQTLEAAGRYDLARQAYERALALAPGHPGARDGLTRVGDGAAP